MKYSRRIFSALVLIVSLLTSQFAVAVYACPIMLRATSASPEVAENGVSGGVTSDLMPCDTANGSDSNDGAVCRAHCDEGRENVGDAFAQLPIAFVVAFSVAIPPLIEIQNARTVCAGLGLNHALGPPLAITHCCLRI